MIGKAAPDLAPPRVPPHCPTLELLINIEASLSAIRGNRPAPRSLGLRLTSAETTPSMQE